MSTEAAGSARPDQPRPADVPLDLDEAELKKVILRLRRAQGQLGGVVGMLESGRDCTEIVHQLVAVKKAIDRTGFVLMEAGIRQCLIRPGTSQADLTAMERLFLKLS